MKNPTQEEMDTYIAEAPTDDLERLVSMAILHFCIGAVVARKMVKESLRSRHERQASRR